mmetsp:Transcript_11562/g.21645  ORF Transcript_11562/g.21645 Transcript_11562/m.21645 type:complete len:189 (+) Transcript_11562:92-658(+)
MMCCKQLCRHNAETAPVQQSHPTSERSPNSRAVASNAHDRSEARDRSGTHNNEPDYDDTSYVPEPPETESNSSVEDSPPVDSSNPLLPRPAPNRSHGTFEITLLKGPHCKWNMDLDFSHENLLVAEIREGPATEWNEANPTLQIEPGDWILELNGDKSKPERMVLDILQSSARIDLLVRKHWSSSHEL